MRGRTFTPHLKEGPVEAAIEDARCRVTYSVGAVAKLIGLGEIPAGATEGRVENEEATPDRNIVDILSQLYDPGGSVVWYRAALQEDPLPWTAEPGGIDPGGELACVVWDFFAAMRELPLMIQAAVILRIVGFTDEETASVLDLSDGELAKALRRHYGPGPTLWPHERALLQSREIKVRRMLRGRPVQYRDEDGRLRELTDDEGNKVYRGGAVQLLARFMSRRRAP